MEQQGDKSPSNEGNNQQIISTVQSVANNPTSETTSDREPLVLSNRGNEDDNSTSEEEDTSNTLSLDLWQPFLETSSAALLINSGELDDFRPTIELHTTKLFDINKTDKPGLYKPDFTWDRLYNLSQKYRYSPQPLDFKHHIKQIRQIAGKNEHIQTNITKYTTELTQNLTGSQKQDIKFLEHQQQRLFLQQHLTSKQHHLLTLLQFLPKTLPPAEQEKVQTKLYKDLQQTIQAQIHLQNFQTAELEFKIRDIIVRSNRAPVPARQPVEAPDRVDVDAVLKQHIKQAKKLRNFLKPKPKTPSIPPQNIYKRPSFTPNTRQTQYRPQPPSTSSTPANTTSTHRRTNNT